MTDLSTTWTNGGASTRTRVFFGSSTSPYTAKLASTIVPVQTAPSGSQSGETWPFRTGSARGPGFCTSGAFSSKPTSNVAGATWPSFHAGNDTVTLALPLAASAGTRTGP